jgi:hypothetical protein
MKSNQSKINTNENVLSLNKIKTIIEPCWAFWLFLLFEPFLP